ncbi:MAG: redoxin domain-containing protein [Saprospiraceae bacterium]|nr:redoxin domain-containing protein [Saprospiraceae bacterium]
MSNQIKATLVILIIIYGLQVNAQVGNSAPDFIVTDVHGKTHRLYDYIEQGKKVIIDFFFTNCIPCQYYSPQVNKAYEKYGCNTQDLIFITIDYNDTDAEVLEYDNTYKIEFPSISGLQGGGNKVVSQYNISAFPTLILIDSTKKIVAEFDPPTLVVFDFKLAMQGNLPKPCLTNVSNVRSQFVVISPSPVQSQNLQIYLDEFISGPAKIEIFDLLGVTVLKKKIHFNNENRYDLKIPELKSGTYLFKMIIGNEKHFVIKFEVI